MTRENKKKRLPKGWYVHAAIILGIFIGIYLILVHIAIPVYTRHSQSIIVPNVTRTSYQAAEKLLEKKHLVPVKGEYRYDDNVPLGFVLFQNPAAGRDVKKGRRVYLTTSLGSRRIKMPDLVGKSERDVRFILERIKLEIGDIEYEFDAFFPNGVVIDQTIDKDMEIEIATPIDLLVSLGEEPTEFIIPDLVGKDLKSAELLLKKACLTQGKVETQSSDKFTHDTVIWQSKEAGLKVAKGDTVDIVVSKIKDVTRGSIQW